MNGKIYKITNTITNESYIGKTIQTIEERFNEHKRGTLNNEKDKTKFHKAMAEYGHRNFEIELIEENITCPIMLGLKETMAILEYGTLQEYNSILGRRSVPSGYGTKEWDYEKYRKSQDLKKRRLEERMGNKDIESQLNKPFFVNSHLIELLSTIKVPHEFNILVALLYVMQENGPVISMDLDELRDEMEYDSEFYVRQLVKYGETLNETVSNIGLFDKFEVSFQERFISVKLADEFNYLIEPTAESFLVDFTILNHYEKVYSKRLYLAIEGANGDSIEKKELFKLIGAPTKYEASKVNAHLIDPFLVESDRIGRPYELKKTRRGRDIFSYAFTLATLN